MKVPTTQIAPLIAGIQNLTSKLKQKATHLTLNSDAEGPVSVSAFRDEIEIGFLILTGVGAGTGWISDPANGSTTIQI
jgi:hypothetical protein